MAFLCTAEQRSHVTDKTLAISDACLSYLTAIKKNLWEKIKIPLTAPLTKAFTMYKLQSKDDLQLKRSFYINRKDFCVLFGVNYH